MLSGARLAIIRRQRGWSQQYLALQSGVNKAYISEYETGIRPSLPPDMMARIVAVVNAEPAGRTSPTIRRKNGRLRLVLQDADGNEYFPDIASVHWSEDDGTSYGIYLGESEA